ncbi:hypothetical protein K3495_g162 [Podosphaera aphanis]|nr:hypothetical protein K3495_g162 [Podosphaera aphanis]
MDALVSRAKELVIDATYGTNSSGMSLLAVLAELDETGVPLCYLFVGTASISDQKLSSADDKGATTCILKQFLQPLKDAGYSSTFFGCDKDNSEISAIRDFWPDATLQLCYWHAKRAIKKKLSDARKTVTQANYDPEKARSFVPTPEICWGSRPTRQPGGDHRYGRCQCQSSKELIAELGRIETVDEAAKDTILFMFSRHFNMHSMIPNQNGTFRSAEQIHFDCINELYAWCRARNYFRRWTYLFINWYAPDVWKLWARSANPDSMPVLKITMMIESHWRRIKHDYLHRFNSPRIDLVTWVLVSRVVPQALERMTAMLKKDHRIATAAWRKAFKRQWKHLQSHQVGHQDLIEHHKDHQSGPVHVDRQPVIRPQFKPRAKLLTSDTDADFSSDIDAESDSESDVESEILNESSDENRESPEDYADDVISTMRFLLETLEKQKEFGNTKFLEVFKANNTKNWEFAAEIKQRQRKKTMPETWCHNKNSGTMLL